MRDKKRGELGPREIGSLAVAAIVFSIMGWSGVSYAKDTTSIKLFYAKDIAYSLDALYAIPGNMMTYYKADPSRFIVEIDDNIVYVSEMENDPTKGIHHYIKSGSEAPKQTFKHEKNIVLTKEAGKVSAATTKEADYRIKECSDIKLGKLKNQKVVVEYNNDNAGWIVSALTSDDKQFAKKTILFSESEQEKTEMIKNGNPEILLSIRIGDYPDEKMIPVKIFFSGESLSKDKNSKVACEIRNALVEQFPEINSEVIIPSNEEILRQNLQNVALLIEVGNINAKDSDMLANMNQVGNTIYSAINKAYTDAE